MPRVVVKQHSWAYLWGRVWRSRMSQEAHSPLSGRAPSPLLGPEQNKKAEWGKVALSPLGCPSSPGLGHGCLGSPAFRITPQGLLGLWLADGRSWDFLAFIITWATSYSESRMYTSVYLIGSISLETLTVTPRLSPKWIPPGPRHCQPFPVQPVSSFCPQSGQPTSASSLSAVWDLDLDPVPGCVVKGFLGNWLCPQNGPTEVSSQVSWSTHLSCTPYIWCIVCIQ